MTTKLLMLALLIAVLIYPVVGNFFASKEFLRSRGGDKSTKKVSRRQTRPRLIDNWLQQSSQ